MDQIRQYLSNLQQEEKIAGMAVAVTDRNKVIFAEGFGVESIERPEVKVRPESMFRIASITKIVTGITLLTLVEEGKLSLDAPVREVLPWLTLSNEETAKNVTLRHLLSHTSGLCAEYTPDGPREESALEPSLREGLPTAEILFPLGKGYQYSNWGIRLASLMAETVTGKRYSELAYERVIHPLGMEQTTFDLATAATYPLCLAHTEADGAFQVCHKISINGARLAAGGLFSNTLDLCRLARCLMNDGVGDNGTRILSEASLQAMKTRHADCKEFDGYGLTLIQTDHCGHLIYGHRGSAPPYATSLMFDPETGLGIATLLNTQRDPLRLSIPKEILNILSK